MNTPNVEAEALAVLEYLARRYGVQMVADVLDTVISAPSAGVLIHDVEFLVAGLLEALISAVEPDVLRAALTTGYAGANAVGDAAVAAKFGPP